MVWEANTLRVDHFQVCGGLPILIQVVALTLSRNSGSVYLLSGLVNVILFTSTRKILPLSSLRIGNWYLVPSSRPSDIDHDGAEKGFFKVTFMEEPTTICTPPGFKDIRRPAELDLSHHGVRDSFASMYSSREGVYIPPLDYIPPLSSHWSPDTPALRKAHRLSVYIHNVQSAAARI